MFECKLRGSSQVVSLCASGDLRAGGTLAYRAGPRGKVMLSFPDSPTGSVGRFRQAHYFRAQTEYNEVSFERDGQARVLYDYPHIREWS